MKHHVLLSQILDLLFGENTFLCCQSFALSSADRALELLQMRSEETQIQSHHPTQTIFLLFLPAAAERSVTVLAAAPSQRTVQPLCPVWSSCCWWVTNVVYWVTGSCCKSRTVSPNDGGERLVIVLWNRPRKTFYHINTLMFHLSCHSCSSVHKSLSFSQMQQFEGKNRKKTLTLQVMW